MGYTTVARSCTLNVNTLLFVNTGTPVASSKWFGLIKTIGQVVLGQQPFAYFRCPQLLVPTTLNITLDIVSTSEVSIKLQYRTHYLEN